MDPNIVVLWLPGLLTFLTLLPYLSFLPFTKLSYPTYVKTEVHVGRKADITYKPRVVVNTRLVFSLDSLTLWWEGFVLVGNSYSCYDETLK